MQWSMRDLGEMFKVSESKVTRWIRHQGLPAQRVAGQYHFNRVEVLDWAVAHQVRMEASPVDQLVDGVPSMSLADALEAGGIHYKISGDERQAALRALVSRLPLPKDFDGELLMGLLLAREAHGFTAVGDGIAIPHVRYPIVLNVVPRSADALLLAQTHCLPGARREAGADSFYGDQPHRDDPRAAPCSTVACSSQAELQKMCRGKGAPRDHLAGGSATREGRTTGLGSSPRAA